MFPIAINTEGTNSSYEQFENEFLRICNRHREENRALVFAFILYDFENPQISKVINDADYWLSLDAISGHYLTVFSFHYKAEDLKARLMDIMKSRMNSGIHKQMAMIETAQNPSTETNKLVRKYFGDDISVRYPSVLFFQTNDDTVTDFRLIQLDEKQIENSFLELKNYIGIAVDALRSVNRDNKHNVREIFSLVDDSVHGTRQAIQIKKGVKKITSIAELTSSVMGLKY